MNWLAHLLLSEPSAEFRLGNLLPDLLRGPLLREVPSQFQRGIECHRRIDAFTDSHPLVHQSKRRIQSNFRRYSGIVVDVFYDHLLCSEWDQHSELPRERLIGEVYESIGSTGQLLPDPARSRLEQMREEDWLGSYNEMEGVREILQRIGERLRHPVPLGDSTGELEEHYEGFQDDFRTFFPELRADVEASCSLTNS